MDTSSEDAVLVAVRTTLVPVVALKADRLVSTELTEPSANASPDAKITNNAKIKIFFIFNHRNIFLHCAEKKFSSTTIKYFIFCSPILFFADFVLSLSSFLLFIHLSSIFTVIIPA